MDLFAGLRRHNEAMQLPRTYDVYDFGTIHWLHREERMLESEGDLENKLVFPQGLNKHVQQAEAMLFPWRVEQPTREECSSSEKSVVGSHTIAATISSVSERELDALGNIGKQEKYQLDNRNQSSNSPSDQSCAIDLGLELDSEPDPEPELRFQPETRPISHEELTVEIQAIYAGLMRVESKCTELQEKEAEMTLEIDLALAGLANIPQYAYPSHYAGKNDGKTLYHKPYDHVQHHKNQAIARGVSSEINCRDYTQSKDAASSLIASLFHRDKPATYAGDASTHGLPSIAHNYTNHPTTPTRLLASANRTVSKVKRGLSGFVNGTRFSAFPDTGSARNVVSESFAKEMKLGIENSPRTFMLGNSTMTRSLGELTSRLDALTPLLMGDHTGTVCLDWAFSEAPKDVMKIVCDVLPNCSYKIILGSSFLTTTQTLSRYRHRLTECVFSMANILTFNFIGNECQRLRGHVGDYGEEVLEVLAVPDTGAEANIMDERFASEYGFRIHKGPAHCNILQFADGSCQRTVGQVGTYWTFDSGERVPVVFEVLENCCSDVILGESILYDHNVFEEHACSIVTFEAVSEIYQLAPFDFVKTWHRKYTSLAEHLRKTNDKGSITLNLDRRSENNRREAWNYKYEFGGRATEEEKEAEIKRRRDFELTQRPVPPAPPLPTSPLPSVLRVPSIAAVSNAPQSSHATANRTVQRDPP